MNWALSTCKLSNKNATQLLFSFTGQNLQQLWAWVLSRKGYELGESLVWGICKFAVTLEPNSLLTPSKSKIFDKKFTLWSLCSSQEANQRWGQNTCDVSDEENFWGLAEQWRRQIPGNSRASCRFWRRSDCVWNPTLFERFLDSSSHRSSLVSSHQLKSQSWSS